MPLSFLSLSRTRGHCISVRLLSVVVVVGGGGGGGVGVGVVDGASETSRSEHP